MLPGTRRACCNQRYRLDVRMNRYYHDKHWQTKRHGNSSNVQALRLRSGMWNAVYIERVYVAFYVARVSLITVDDIDGEFHFIINVNVVIIQSVRLFGWVILNWWFIYIKSSCLFKIKLKNFDKLNLCIHKFAFVLFQLKSRNPSFGSSWKWTDVSSIL